MNIIEVIPIARGIGAETLSYFTSKEIKPGSLVEIPLRNRKISGLVVSQKNVSDSKSSIKTAGFALKKIEEIKAQQFLSPAFIKAAEETANFFAGSVGSVLKVLVPEALLKIASTLEFKEHLLSPVMRQDMYVVQGNDQERIGHHKSLIRQEFAKKKSVIVVVPTIEDGRYVSELLEKGIEDYTFFIHSGLSQNKISSTIKKIYSQEHPILVICTGSFLAIPRHDIGSIIVEKEHSRGYKALVRPYVDMRFFAEIFARKTGAKFYVADILLRIETLHRETTGDFIQSPPFKFRSLTTAKEILIDMRTYKSTSGSFKILSDEAEKLIIENKERSEHMFIYALRRGVAPMTVCADCQNIVTCKNCSAPVTLHTSGQNSENNSPQNSQHSQSFAETFFMCHKCGEKRSAEEYCIHCESWRLGTVGIGIDLVAQKIRDKHPDVKVFQIDADSAKNDSKIKETIEDWKQSPGSILLGTEMVLNFLHEPIHNSVVVSLDSLFSLPDFRIHEKIFYTLLRIQTLTTKTCIVQTRNPDEHIFDLALKGNLVDFLRGQLDDRKLFKYPPFVTLIKITISGNRDEIMEEMESLKEYLTPHLLEIFPAFIHTIKGKYILNSLMKIMRNDWPHSELTQKLKGLPPYISVKVDPESLL